MHGRKNDPPEEISGGSPVDAGAGKRELIFFCITGKARRFSARSSFFCAVKWTISSKNAAGTLSARRV